MNDAKDERFLSICLVVRNFRSVNGKKIDTALRDIEQFRQALSMVEDLMDNDQLCRYFSSLVKDLHCVQKYFTFSSKYYMNLVMLAL